MSGCTDSDLQSNLPVMKLAASATYSSVTVIFQLKFNLCENFAAAKGQKFLSMLFQCSGSQCSIKTVYRLKTLLLDRHTSKCFNKDITEYLDCLDKYQNKCINKYKTKLIDKHKNKRMGKYKNQLHQEVNLSPIPSGALVQP